jgi:hypothetical protein
MEGVLGQLLIASKQRLMSNDLQSKRVGAVALGFVAEGFAQVLREQLSDVIPLLVQVHACDCGPVRATQHSR